MSSHICMLVILTLCLPSASLTQLERRGSDQKTIEISATEKVRVPAETATIKIGFQNQAATKDVAYAENTRAANKILQALLDAGVPKEAIETETLNLGQEQERYEAKSNPPARYTAKQQWQIYSKAGDAQKVVDIAIAAGANQIESVDWSVADDKQLETRAYAAALKRARELAEQTATQSGLKLGEIVTIANSSAPERFTRFEGRQMRKLEMFAMLEEPKLAMLKLQPGTVEQEASVTVIFAIAP